MPQAMKNNRKVYPNSRKFERKRALCTLYVQSENLSTLGLFAPNLNQSLANLRKGLFLLQTFISNIKPLNLILF